MVVVGNPNAKVWMHGKVCVLAALGRDFSNLTLPGIAYDREKGLASAGPETLDLLKMQ